MLSRDAEEPEHRCEVCREAAPLQIWGKRFCDSHGYALYNELPTSGACEEALGNPFPPFASIEAFYGLYVARWISKHRKVAA